jgi:hypothetical protein
MRNLELTFTSTGGAEVSDGPDDVVWSSDDDDEFRDEFENEFLNVKDEERVIQWLVDHDIVTEDESEDLEVFEEETDGDGKTYDADVETP